MLLYYDDDNKYIGGIAPHRSTGIFSLIFSFFISFITYNIYSIPSTISSLGMIIQFLNIHELVFLHHLSFFLVFGCCCLRVHAAICMNLHTTQGIPAFQHHQFFFLFFFEKKKRFSFFIKESPGDCDQYNGLNASRVNFFFSYIFF